MNPEIVMNLDRMSPQFVVSDIDASIRFCTEALGCELNIQYQDLHAGVICTGHSIHLKSGDVSLAERKFKRDNQHLDNTFGVLDIDEGLPSDLRKRN
ncbi:MAG: hypothetical protein AAFX93_06015 [Verrucomicrobiota bacterium]